MKSFFKRLWAEEEGAETAEWVVIVALLVIVAVFIYRGILQGTLENVVTGIESTISAGTS